MNSYRTSFFLTATKISRSGDIYDTLYTIFHRDLFFSARFPLFMSMNDLSLRPQDRCKWQIDMHSASLRGLRSHFPFSIKRTSTRTVFSDDTP